MKSATKPRSGLAILAFGAFFTASSILAGETKDWALLTYMNGFNSLDDDTYKDMNEMEKVGSTDRIHVVSQWASLKTKEVRRVYVVKDSDPSRVTSAAVENLGRIDMGDYRSLVEFVKWAVKKYPARHYFLNIWNHGNGWRFRTDRSADGEPKFRDLSYDDLSKNRITTPQLGVAMAEISGEIGRKIDVLGSDSCLMAMAEVVGQVKESVDHFVGSQELEPTTGWPYDALLEKWNEGGAKSAAEVASILANAYVDANEDHDDATLSGMDVGSYATLAASVRELGEAIKSAPLKSRQRVMAAVFRAQSYGNDDYKDLGDLVDQIAGDAEISIRPEILAGVKDALGRFVVVNRATRSMRRSQGVSIWFPNFEWQLSLYGNRYQPLAFNRETAWIDAISSVIGVSGAP